MANYGNYGSYYPQQQNSLAALEAQLQQLRAMQSPIQNQSLPPTNGVLQVGTYVVVKTLQDMENYGVPVDGTPVNIFIENSGVFYSKKMNKGITTCQPFTFSPLNVNKQVETPAPEQTPEQTPAWANDLIERVSALEKRSYKKPTTKKVEDLDDGV